MAYKVVKDFLWFKKKDIIEEPDQKWIDEKLVEEVGKKPKVNLDLNGDGKVDKKDRSIAGKVLALGRKKKKKK